MMNPEISFPCIMIHITHRHYLSLRVSRRYQLHHPIFFSVTRGGMGVVEPRSFLALHHLIHYQWHWILRML
jgi:hypothetical protein